MGNTILHTSDSLVSIVVITYNSSATVLETLESIANQTYSNLELIISDDCSRDNTIEICQKWIKKHLTRFKKVKLITSDNNTGTSANLNRGVKDAQGIWVKPIAGDDKLLVNCIVENINFVNEHPDTDLLFSRVKYFGNLDLLKGHQKFKYDYFKLSPKKFYEKLIQGNFLPTASVFIKRNLYEKIGYYDESIPLLEDWPFWMKAGFNHYSFKFLDIDTVEYRIQESVSMNRNKSSLYSKCESAAIRLSLEYQKKHSRVLWLKLELRLFVKRFL